MYHDRNNQQTGYDWCDNFEDKHIDVHQNQIVQKFSLDQLVLYL